MKITKCLFPVAGYGTRFCRRPRACQRRFADRQQAAGAIRGRRGDRCGNDHLCAMVTGRGKRAIADHFDISYELEHQISGSGKAYLESIRSVLDKRVYSPWCASAR